jgi:ABC-type polysaccharide transport system permease subunit
MIIFGFQIGFQKIVFFLSIQELGFDGIDAFCQIINDNIFIIIGIDDIQFSNLDIVFHLQFVENRNIESET